MHQKFHSGYLLRAMIDANKRYGHGLGGDQSLSIEQLAHIGVTSWHASLEQQRP